MSAGNGDDLLSIGDAAKVVGVTKQTIRNHFDRGWIPVTFVNGVRRIRRSDLENAKILRTLDAESQGVSEVALDQAVRSGQIVLEDGRCSLADARRIREASAPAPTNPAAPPLIAAFSTANELERYREHRKISAIDARFFDTPFPPPFHPPVDLCRHSYGETEVPGGLANTPVIRSAGWFSSSDGPPTYSPEQRVRLEAGWHPAGSTPRWAEEGNRLFQEARSEWLRRWATESTHARTMDPAELRLIVEDVRLDFRAALLEYIRTQSSPCDLPWWFWRRTTCPRFEPAPLIHYRTWGAPQWDSAGGQWMVVVNDSAGWEWIDDVGGPVRWVAPGQHLAVANADGLLPELASEYVDDNHRYASAHEEWVEQYRRHGPNHQNDKVTPSLTASIRASEEPPGDDS